MMLMPLRPVLVPTEPEAPVPLMLKPRSRTIRSGSLALPATLMLMPLVKLARIEPNVWRQSIVIDYTEGPKIEGYREVPDKLVGPEGLNIRDEIRFVRPGFYLHLEGHG